MMYVACLSVKASKLSSSCLTQAYAQALGQWSIVWVLYHLSMAMYFVS